MAAPSTRRECTHPRAVLAGFSFPTYGRGGARTCQRNSCRVPCSLVALIGAPTQRHFGVPSRDSPTTLSLIRTQDLDASVIGAGPAGCCAASVLARAGRKVAVLEREPLPRYRVGESLLPHCWFPLNRLGLVDAVDASGFVVPKHSVQFISTEGVSSRPFYFFQHSDHPKARTWQVKRQEFDQLLIEHTIESGARLLEETAAHVLLRDEHGAVIGVEVEDEHGRRPLHARVTIDASGRDLFAASRNKWRVSDEHLNKVAIWSYFEGAKRDPGVDEGATTIAYLEGRGWFWYIPLANDQVSVGVVADAEHLFRDERDPAAIFAREVAAQPWIAEHLATGRRLVDFRTTRDFSYRARHCAEDGLVLTGDAFSFLDPVFSSGVLLALHGGILAGDAVEAALEANDVRGESFADYGETLCRNIENMRQLVHAFYDPQFSFSRFLGEHPRFREDVTDILIGDLDRDYRELFAAIQGYARVPQPLVHGGPLGDVTRAPSSRPT